MQFSEFWIGFFFGVFARLCPFPMNSTVFHYQSDLTQLFLESVDFVRNTGGYEDISSGRVIGMESERKRSLQTYDDIPWGWAAIRIMELLQAYPSGLTSVILR